MLLENTAASGQAKYSTPLVRKNRPQRCTTWSATAAGKHERARVHVELRTEREQRPQEFVGRTPRASVPENGRQLTVFCCGPRNDRSRYSARLQKRKSAP